METKTNKEIEALKREWSCDPCWDIENTEGFEAHKVELREFRISIEAEQEKSYNEKLKEKAEKLGVPDRIDLVKYLNTLEYKIQLLENKIDQLDNN